MSQKLADSPLVRAMIYRVVKYNNIKIRSRVNIMNTDLVPRVSEKVVNRGLLGQRRISPMNRRVPQIRRPRQIMRPPQTNFNQMTRQATTADILMSPEGYGKLQPLLVDPTVTSIECPGANKLLTIIRTGQVQGTRISLTQEDINSLLKKVSEKSRIPLVDGVFRAAVDNFIISAVVSGVIGSRFVIKKQTPYSLLEGGGY